MANLLVNIREKTQAFPLRSEMRQRYNPFLPPLNLVLEVLK